MMKLLISACLLGHKVRYDGKDNLLKNLRLQDLINSGAVVNICPEMMGGLLTPRPPAEIEAGKTAIDVLQGNAKVITDNNQDVTQAYIDGAYKTLIFAQQHHVRIAILKARSPSCGSEKIYDGTFSRTLVTGMGVTAALLSQHGIQVFDEERIDEALDILEGC
ncbi:MAG: DUF523 domain-containing protein [Coxiellaceae bacterium]|nr:MAG: DUF523 domain-containing protein [Coxiellaceae bacterium]